LAALTISIATAVRRVVADAEMLPRLVASIAAFVVFPVASGLAQWYVATLHVSPATAAGQAALVFRVAMPVAIEPFEHALSLDHEGQEPQALASPSRREMAEAIQQANLSHLRVEQARA
jgi:hypothetical protein